VQYSMNVWQIGGGRWMQKKDAKLFC
jgi:hypothetical protein